MPADIIFFHKGLSFDARSALQQPGFLNTAKNISLSVMGEQGLRPAFGAINSTALSAVHTIRRFKNILLAGASTGLYGNSLSGDFTTLYSSLSGSPLKFRQYKEFLHGTDGAKGILVDEDKNVYPAEIANPATAPTGAAGAAGNPSGHYFLYVSFLITWPNGQTYETGLSPVSADVSVTSQAISWSAIPVSTYAEYYGTAPTIHRKLYRGPGTGGTLTDIYYVATITDNTTTTYTDDDDDATIGANDACAVEDFEPVGAAKCLEYHYGRCFFIDPDNVHRMYYTEPVGGTTASENETLMPLAMYEDNWEDLRVPAFDEVDPQGLIAWGAYLYIPLKNTWMRKQGDDPDTWSIKKLWAGNGIAAPMTMDICGGPQGIIGMANPNGNEPALALFDGNMSNVISSPRLDKLFKNDMNIDALENCRGRMIGRYYHLLYPSGTSTTPDKHLVLDFRRFPDISVAFWEDLAAMSTDAYSQSKHYYFGGSDGVVRGLATTETIDVDVETHELTGGDPKIVNDKKVLKELKYSLNTGGDDVTLEIYVDNVLMKWPDDTTSKVISGTDETVQIIRSFPQNAEGYSFRIRVYGSVDTFELYSPWKLEMNLKG